MDLVNYPFLLGFRGAAGNACLQFPEDSAPASLCSPAPLCSATPASFPFHGHPTLQLYKPAQQPLQSIHKDNNQSSRNIVFNTQCSNIGCQHPVQYNGFQHFFFIVGFSFGFVFYFSLSPYFLLSLLPLLG